MPTYLPRDLAAFTLGLTPRYGYCWPSAVEGRLAFSCDGWDRMIVWAKREGIALFAVAWTGLMAYALDVDWLKVAVVAAGAAIIVRSAARAFVLRRTATRRTRR